jgi:hypothetical protein
MGPHCLSELLLWREPANSAFELGRFARTSRHTLPVSSRMGQGEPRHDVGGRRGEAMGRGTSARWQSRRRWCTKLDGASLAAEPAW